MVLFFRQESSDACESCNMHKRKSFNNKRTVITDPDICSNIIYPNLYIIV